MISMARPVGSRETEVKQIKTIVELSLEGRNRSVIAEHAEVSKKTVYNYQRDFGLI